MDRKETIEHLSYGYEDYEIADWHLSEIAKAEEKARHEVAQEILAVGTDNKYAKRYMQNKCREIIKQNKGDDKNG